MRRRRSARWRDGQRRPLRLPIAFSPLLKPINEVAGDGDAAGHDGTGRGHNASSGQKRHAAFIGATHKPDQLIDLERHLPRRDSALRVVHVDGARYDHAALKERECERNK